MSFQKFRQECIKLVGISGEKLALEEPPKGVDADLALPCFQISKKPVEKAKELENVLKKKINKSSLVKNVMASGPYLNFYINWDKFNEIVLQDVLKNKEKYGSSPKKRKRIMIEYSSPNSNKPLHVGHLRNDSIGMCVSNILEFSGFDVVRAILVNDRGIHICKSMLAYKKWGQKDTPESKKIKSDHFVGDYYVLFSKKETPETLEEARDLLRKCEDEDKNAIALLKKMNNWAVGGMKETYKLFGSRFDVWFFETEFYKKAKPIIVQGIKKGIFFKDKDGVIKIKLDKYDLPEKVIVRADGTSIYISNDLSLTKYKFEKYKLNRSIWCVASEQILYFKQLFKILELLGYKWSKDCYHLSYGMVSLPSGKMKSREGTVIDADDLIKDVTELAKKEILIRYPKINKPELEKRSIGIGLAAIKYYFLKTDTIRDILFEPEKAISFEGDTGPYLQYTYARARSILKKSKIKSMGKFDSSKLTAEQEKTILKKLSMFDYIIEKCAESMKPHYLANYLFDLATLFNEFYHALPVIGSDEEKERLALTNAVSIVLKNGLTLLGIEAPEKM